MTRLVTLALWVLLAVPVSLVLTACDCGCGQG